jgi:glycine/D-amino acid oxidase-like deaminating enzyme
MGPIITAVQTNSDMPSVTAVVIIGGGMVGLTAALSLAEQKIPVVVLEKGRIAGEQSSRNLGWVRKTSRLAEDIPLALAADRLWAEMPERTGFDVGYRQEGIMFIARTEEEMAPHESWIRSVEHLSLGSRLLSAAQIDEMVPGGQGKWAGGIYTASDGRAEPTLAASAVAKAAIAKGVVIIENCAVRSLCTQEGYITGVVTERGEIRCEQVLLAGGLWSRRFLGNAGLSLPTLPLIASVIRTRPMEGPTDISVGAPDFSFRRHIDGGYIITQRGILEAPLTIDHLTTGTKFIPQLRKYRNSIRVSLGSHFIKDMLLPREWGTSYSPFEQVRAMDPRVSDTLNADAMANLTAAWPVFERAHIAHTWAGMIDVTPDSNPVIGPVDKIPGLTIATGFSGHGFGTSPAAGRLAADLMSGNTPIVDPTPYRFDRL